MQNNVRKAFIRLGSIIYDLYSQGTQDVWQQEGVKNLLHQIDGYKYEYGRLKKKLR